MTTIATIVGARPQFIKVAPVSRALRETGRAREVLIHTGQHFDADMSDVFFAELDLPPPDHHLAIHGGGHGAMTGTMLQRIEPLLEALRPDWVLVYGDTNSTLAGALAAAKLHIPVAHVEAGLRSGNRRMPEEINRIVTDHLADLLFSTTDIATANLRAEGVADTKIHQVGDVMYDAALQFRARAEGAGTLARLGLAPGGYVLATVHRAENTVAAVLPSIVAALDEIAEHLPVVLPLHPRTRNSMAAMNLAFQRVTVVPPQGFIDMIALEVGAAVIATDSGGVQKEAFFYRVPCVTLRAETEWVELVEAGWNRLAPPGEADIAALVLAAAGSRGKDIEPYGSGRASTAIAARLG